MWGTSTVQVLTSLVPSPPPPAVPYSNIANPNVYYLVIVVLTVTVGGGLIALVTFIVLRARRGKVASVGSARVSADSLRPGDGPLPGEGPIRGVHVAHQVSAFSAFLCPRLPFFLPYALRLQRSSSTVAPFLPISLLHLPSRPAVYGQNGVDGFEFVAWSQAQGRKHVHLISRRQRNIQVITY